jgi:hypothetical protein
MSRAKRLKHGPWNLLPASGSDRRLEAPGCLPAERPAGGPAERVGNHCCDGRLSLILAVCEADALATLRAKVPIPAQIAGLVQSAHLGGGDTAAAGLRELNFLALDRNSPGLGDLPGGEKHAAATQISGRQTPALLASLAFILLCGLCLAPAASEYTASGTYQFETHQLPLPGAPQSRTNLGTFKVSVRDHCWWIDCRPERVKVSAPGVGVLPRDDVISLSYDGTNIYEIYKVSLPDTEEVKEFMKDKTNVISCTAQLLPGAVPQRADDRIWRLWLGLASGSYFASHRGPMLERLSLPPEDGQKPDPKRNVFADISLGSSPLGLPNSLTYYSNEAMKGIDKGRGTPETILQTEDWTNAGSMKIPRVFEVRTFWQSNLSIRQACCVTSVVAVASVEAFRPALPCFSRIVDRRLIDLRPVIAVDIFGTNWPTEKQSRARYKEIKALKGPGSSRSAILLVFAASVILFPLFLLYRRVRERRKTN